jgi:hypothetical protein
MSQLKKLSAEFIKIAEQLPEQFQVQRAKVKMTGKDIHLSGLDTEGIADDDEEHLLTIPIYLEVNHKRNIQKAYKKNGIKGVIQYTESCLNDL